MSEEAKEVPAPEASPPVVASQVPDPNCSTCHGTGEKKPGKPCKACHPKSTVCSKCNGTGVVPGKDKPCKCAKKSKKTKEAAPPS